MISIIIPTYNAQETLMQCLESIVAQKFKDFETIIVDSISTDNTVHIAKRYAASYNNLRWISEKDNGIYDAMNKGIEIAKGEWIYFLGSDDTLYNEDVLSLVADNIDDACEIIYGNSIWVPNNVNERGEWGHYQLLNSSINHQRIFYKASLLKGSGAFNLLYKIASDYELNIRLFCDPAIHKKYIDIPIANYYSGGFSANKVDEDFWNNWRIIIHKNLAPYLPGKEIYKRVSWYCWYMLQQKRYTKAFGLFCSIYFRTFSFTFLKHTLSQTIKVFRSNIKKDKVKIL